MKTKVYEIDSWGATRNTWVDSEVLSVEAGEWKALLSIESDLGVSIRPKGASGSGESFPAGRHTATIRLSTSGKIQVMLPGGPLTPIPRTGVKIQMIELINAVRSIEYEVTTGSASIKIYDANAPFKFLILDLVLEPRGASVNGTMKITNGTNDITNAMVCAVDKTMVKPTTIDNQYSTIAKDGTLEIVCAGDAVGSTIGLLTIKIAERD
ncbi:hypothetical protein LCGC14_2467300 [marine sediment metagenome]|uniref:Uncharacterized protein n=1 Tax=marine sediment metagenome TaxID=412755 RepID=A0A0F9DNK4_9ZZZZ